MTNQRIVLTTAGSEEEAQTIARHLVEHRLAACVNIVSQVKSFYRWQGKVEESHEWLLFIKTTAAAFDQVREAISKIHSFDVPECLCLTIEAGSAEYLEWLAQSVAVKD